MPTSKSLQTRHQEPEESPGFLIWVITNRWQAAQRATLKPFGLTHVQMILLAALVWLEGEGPVSQRQLADQAATDPMMTSQVIRVLESRSLVRRYPHPSDGRARALETTAAGRSLVNRALAAVEDCDAEFFSVLGDQMEALTSGLKVLHDAHR
jgi:DNA-binding MarR family transcriptional regulator